jgi:hypothetical protein
MSYKIRPLIRTVMLGTLVAGAAGSAFAQDPGINQPGAAGNKGAAVHRDPGINQPGAAGNR